MSTATDLHLLAEAIKGRRTQVRLRQGVVTDVAADGSLSVAIAGSAVSVSGVRMLASAADATTNSVVWMLTDGVDLIVIGALAPLV